MWVFTARVAIIFGVSQSVTPIAWNRLQTSGSATKCHGGCRQRATTPKQDRFLMVQARRHPFVNATTLLNELRNAVGVNISTQTVHNSLQQSDLRPRREFIRIPLTRLHKQAPLNWTRDHVKGLITIGILYCSPMSNGTVLTLQIDVFVCGEDMWSDFKMPICLNMTAMEEAPSWFGLISAEMEEQTHTS